MVPAAGRGYLAAAGDGPVDLAGKRAQPVDRCRCAVKAQGRSLEGGDGRDHAVAAPVLAGRRHAREAHERPGRRDTANPDGWQGRHRRLTRRGGSVFLIHVYNLSPSSSASSRAAASASPAAASSRSAATSQSASRSGRPRAATGNGEPPGAGRECAAASLSVPAQAVSPCLKDDSLRERVLWRDLAAFCLPRHAPDIHDQAQLGQEPPHARHPSPPRPASAPRAPTARSPPPAAASSRTPRRSLRPASSPGTACPTP